MKCNFLRTAAIALLCAAIVCSCGKDGADGKDGTNGTNGTNGADGKNSYLVIFDSNGGTPMFSMNGVMQGDKITAPEDPTKAGYTFDGWFKETALTNAWNFATDVVTANITLYAKWNVIPVVDFFTLDDASNSNTQQGWNVTGIMSEIAAAKYLVLETDGGEGTLDGFIGINFIFQGNNGDPATIEVGWTQRNLNDDWVSFPRAVGKTISILIDIKKVFGDKYADFLQCTYWARMIIGYYTGTTAFKGLGLTGAYIINDFAKPADAVDLVSGYGFIIEGTVF